MKLSEGTVHMRNTLSLEQSYNIDAKLKTNPCNMDLLQTQRSTCDYLGWIGDGPYNNEVDLFPFLFVVY